MSSKPKKVVVLGWDGAHPEMIHRYRAELPNITALMQRGVFAVNCLAPYPTITPPNWTTLATGAWPGTHGLTCFWMHHEGDELDQLSSAFDSRQVRAEYVWEAMERIGKKPIVFNWPSSWPPRVKAGIQIDGEGLCVGRSVAHESSFSTDDRDGPFKVHPDKAEAWKNLPNSQLPPLQIALDMPLADDRRQLLGSKERRYVLITASTGSGYDQAVFTTARDASSPLVRLESGKMTDWIFDTFDVPGQGKAEVAYKLKLAELSADGRRFELFWIRTTRTSGWAHPPGLDREIVENCGPPIAATSAGASRRGLTDYETYITLEEEMHDWYARAAAYLLRKYPWDGLFMHVHAVDFANHIFMHGADKLGSGAEKFDICNHYLMRAYKASDHVLGKLMEAAGDDTLYIVVSDHGSTTRVHVTEDFGNPHGAGGEILARAGLLAFSDKPRDKWPGGFEIDWSRTKAICQRAAYVYVNLKGRDPHGIVEPADSTGLVSVMSSLP